MAGKIWRGNLPGKWLGKSPAAWLGKVWRVNLPAKNHKVHGGVKYGGDALPGTWQRKLQVNGR